MIKPISLKSAKTVKILQEMAEFLEKEQAELVEDRRRTGAYIEEDRRLRAKFRNQGLEK